MKTKYIKQLFSAALIAVLSSGVTSCINDLDISPIDPQTGGSFDQQGVFVKGYAMLGVTGQRVSTALLTSTDRTKANPVSIVPLSTATSCLPTNVFGHGRRIRTSPSLQALAGVLPASAQSGFTSVWDMTSHNTTSSSTRPKA